MKKIVSRCIACIMLLWVLTACSGNNGNEDNGNEDNGNDVLSNGIDNQPQSSVGENGSDNSYEAESPEEMVYGSALECIEQGFYDRAYDILNQSALKNYEPAKELLKCFTLLPYRVQSEGDNSIYYVEYLYDDQNRVIEERRCYNQDFDEDSIYGIFKWTYDENGKVAKQENTYYNKYFRTINDNEDEGLYQSKYSVEKTEISYGDNGKMLRRTYTSHREEYDVNGTVIGECDESKDEVYNEAGVLISEIRSEQEAGNPTIYYQEEYFDDRGNEIKKYIYTLNTETKETSVEVLIITENFYDEKGLLIKSVSKDENKTKMFEYVYGIQTDRAEVELATILDEAGNIIEKNYEIHEIDFDEAANVTTERAVYKYGDVEFIKETKPIYGEDGILQEEHISFTKIEMRDGAIRTKEVETAVQTYDANGRLIKSEKGGSVYRRLSETEVREGEMAITVIEYVYDDNGNLVSETESRNGDGIIRDYKYTFNENGALVELTRIDEFRTVTAKFDENGSCCFCKQSDASGNEEVLVEYVYDENGVLTSWKCFEDNSPYYLSDSSLTISCLDYTFIYQPAEAE